MFTVIDVETTGGTARSHKIIEIAIVTLQDGSIVDHFSTLVNPQRSIPPFITSLTGISNEMVADAPNFSEIADTVLKKTEDKVFVAHNVNFDYNFVREEFSALNIRFDRKKLCTVRLAKKIFPGLRSYGLGSLTGALKINIDNRHRALGDAMATGRVMEFLLQNDKDDFIGYSLKRNSREATLPANLPKKVFEELPERTGVYYFHDAKGKVVYVGKARNIKNRIIGHFTGDSGKSKRLFHENIHNISYELTGNELIALLLESREIKRLWPRYNRSQKRSAVNQGLFLYTDRSGYDRFTISKMQAGPRPITNFRSYQDGRNFLNEWIKKFRLCPKLCGLQKSPAECFDNKLGLCDGACNGDISPQIYNQRVQSAIESLGTEKRTYAIIGPGREKEERSLVLVENGIYLGHGFTDYDQLASRFEDLRDRIEPFTDNHDIQNILNMHMKNPNGDDVIYF